MKEVKHYILLIFLTGILFGVIRYQLGTRATDGIFLFPSDDSYITLSYSIRLAKGFPFKLNPDSKPTPLEPSLLIQSIYASAYLMGFKTPKALSFFAFWINIIFLSISMVFIFLVLRQIGFSDDYALITTLFILLFTPFRYSFVMGVGYGLFTALFYMFIYLFLQKRTLFILPLSLMIISRPEGTIVAGLTFLFLFFKKIYELKKILIYFSLPFLFFLLQSTLWLLLTGNFTTSGLPTQYLFTLYPVSGAILMILNYFIEYLKGIILSFYPQIVYSVTRISFSKAQFPPLFFILIILGFFKIQKEGKAVKDFFIYSYILFFITLFISSLTIFQGVHILRHTGWILPIFIITGFKGMEYLRRFIGEHLTKGVLAFYFTLMTFLSISFILENTALNIKLSIPHYLAAKWIQKNLKPEERNFLVYFGSRLFFFLNGNVRLYPLTYPDNWRIVKYGKKVKSMNAPYEVFYYELREHPQKIWLTFFTKEEEGLTDFEIFSKFIDTIIKKENILSDNYYIIAKFNTKPLLNARKLYAFNDDYKILDEINPGDPLSESKHNYVSYLKFPYGKAFPFLTFGKIKKGDSTYYIADLSYLNEYEAFNFYTDGNSKDSIFLTVRVCALIPYLISYNQERFNSTIELRNQYMKIFLNGRKIDSLFLKDVKNFTERVILLPKNILKNGRNSIEIIGKFTSSHYFIIKKGGDNPLP